MRIDGQPKVSGSTGEEYNVGLKYRMKEMRLVHRSVGDGVDHAGRDHVTRERLAVVICYVPFLIEDGTKRTGRSGVDRDGAGVEDLLQHGIFVIVGVSLGKVSHPLQGSGHGCRKSARR